MKAQNFVITLAIVTATVFFKPATAGEQVTFALPGIIIPDLAIYYAVSGGFMAKQGLDAKILQAERRDLATLAVVSGDAIGSITDPIEAAIAFERGAGLKVVAGLAVNAPPSIVGDKSITQNQKTWRGKTVSLFTPPNTLYTLFIRELKLGGWKEVEPYVYRLDAGDSEKEYLRISLGRRGTELATMLAGRSNFAVLHEPDASTAVLRGNMHVIKAFAGSFEQLLWSTLNASEEKIKSNPAIIQKVVNGFNAALMDMHANPDKAIAFALTLFPKADAKVMETAVKNLFKVGVFPKNCMIADIGWKSNVELLKLTNPAASAANVPFDKIADMSFCKKAIAASGS